ncbi:MAG: (2Fe-2S)-binding protein [Chloroflexota bacterium]
MINGQRYQVDLPEDELLLWVIRDGLGMTGTKYGCGIGICGSCTVMVDGQARRSCVTPASAVTDAEITTIEGLATYDDAGQEVLHPVQTAFIEQQVPQCSWCMSGQMMTAAAFLQENAEPTPEEIEAAMSANYCRCGCYARIRLAVADAANQINEAGTEGESES